MSARTIKDATRQLQSLFSGANTPSSLPAASRRMLQHFVDEHSETLSEEESARASVELKAFWEKYVSDGPQKLGAFAGVLKELQPAILACDNLWEWYERVAKPVICGTGFGKSALEDAQDFLVGTMLYDDEDEEVFEQATLSKRLCDDLLSVYISQTRGLTDLDQFMAPENAQVTQRLERVLVTFGRKQPTDLFRGIDDLVTTAATRLQALTMLSSFLRHQAPHIHLVVNTSLVEHLIKCMMNDVSTTILSVALTSLIMLLPHIPGSLGPHLPKLFLIYSRLLCWEKFSPQSSDAQKSLVTDDRVSTDVDEGQGPSDVGIDPSWETARPADGMVEATTPEVLTYFTYLYGLYPLNFMNYIRKPRKYLKGLDFPDADDFDLDQAVIRGRSDQFREAHLLHPNFCNLTLEEELADPKWAKMDPADVVAECHGLCMSSRPSLTSPGPPPAYRLPDPPQKTESSHSFSYSLANNLSGQHSSSPNHLSERPGSSRRDTPSTTVPTPRAGDSPTLRPQSTSSEKGSSSESFRSNRNKANHVPTHASLTLDGFPQPDLASPMMSRDDPEQPRPQTNLAYLQRENTLLKNELNFERWHKAQYSQHIGQLMRKNVKNATAEAETLNLINQNRVLKQQLEQVRKAREITIKDSILTRKQANSLEANIVERFNKMKTEQETWVAEGEELKRLRLETKQYRDLLVSTESRELNKSRELGIMKRDIEQLEKVQNQLEEAQKRIHEYEYREFEYDHAIREKEILEREKESLRKRVSRLERDGERVRNAYAEQTAELEAQLDSSDLVSRRASEQTSSPNLQLAAQQAAAESQAKLTQLKKAHSRLLDKHTDLELDFQSLKSRLDAVQSKRTDQSLVAMSVRGDRLSFNTRNNGFSDGYDILSLYDASSEPPHTGGGSDPSGRRLPPLARHSRPVSSRTSEAAMHSIAGLTWNPSVTSLESRTSEMQTIFNPTAPLSDVDDGSDRFSENEERVKKKIQPDSQVRVYGRGGAQNIKLKSKDGKEKADKGNVKSSGFGRLRGFI